MTAIGKGNINVKTNLGKLITLKNVLFVPKLSQNLLSVSYATKNPKIRFQFENKKCNIYYKNNLIAKAKTQESLLILTTDSNHINRTNFTKSQNWRQVP